MILAGDGHSNVHMRDSLANPVDGTKGGGYDVVITNMPYSQKTKYGNLYDLPSNNGDSICVQHCMKAINATSENGRMALVVPEGFLFRKDLSKTRELLLKNCDLRSVISLPQGVFLPYTGVKTNIIYATKVNQNLKPSQKHKNFWYFEVKSDGYTLDNHRRKIDSGNDLDKYQEYRKLDDDQQQEMLDVGFEVIPLKKVKENSNILVGSRYRETRTTISTSFSLTPKVSLSDEQYFSIYSGGTPDTQNSTYWDGGINWITLADLPSENNITKIYSTERTITKDGINGSNAKLLPIETVVVSTRATIGRVGIAKTELATNQGFKNIVIKDTNVILPEYLAYAISSQKDKMISMASGATFKEISKSNFGTIQIPLLPIEAQKQIIEELERYQRIIDGARNVIENYTPHFPILPEWQIMPLGDICSFEYGYTDIALDTGNARYIRITDITADGLLSDNAAKYVTLSDENKKYLLKKNDVLVARIGATYGKTLFFSSDKTAVFASYLIRLTFDQRVIPKYYWCFAQSDYYWNQARNLVTGGGQPQFNANTMRLINVPIPSTPEQEKIVEQIELEQKVIEPSRKIIDVFMKKMQHRINEIGR